MTLAEKIAAAKAALVTKKDALQVLTNKMTALAEGDDPDEADVVQIEELSGGIEKAVESLAILEKAEAALARGAQPAGSEGGGRTAPAVATGGHLKRKGSCELLVRSAIAAFESHVTHRPIEDVISTRWPQSLEVAETSKLLAFGQVNKAAQNPAMTNVAGWAAELVRDSYSAFMELLLTESIVPQIPMARHEFDGFGKIVIPTREPGAAGQNLAGAFRAEGAPIRVGRGNVGKKELTPKSMGVIGTFTKELLRRSTPNIEQLVRDWMVTDTAEVLDSIYLDAVAGDAIRPAGIRNGLAAGNTAASTGNTAAQIQADIRARLTAMTTARLGSRPVWLMNPARLWGVAMSLTAAGDKAFPEASATPPRLAGIPVLTSLNVPADVVFLVDAAYVTFAGGAPTFEGTDVATIHEDDGAPNADGVTGDTVLPIATGAAGAGVVATPVRSLFQTHSAAVKAVWEIDWAVLRAGAVQTITAVGW